MAPVYHTISIYPYPIVGLSAHYFDPESELTVVDCNDHYELQNLGDGSNKSLYINTTNFGLTTSCTFSFTRTVDRDITVSFNKSPSGGLSGNYERPYTISYTGGSN